MAVLVLFVLFCYDGWYCECCLLNTAGADQSTPSCDAVPCPRKVFISHHWTWQVGLAICRRSAAHAQRHTALSKCSAGRVRGRRGREQALCLPCWLLGQTWARLRILHEGFGHVGRCFVRSLSVGALSRGLPNWATGWSVGKKNWRRPCTRTSHVNAR